LEFRRVLFRSKLFIVIVIARLLNAFTHVVILWIGKLIIDEIILQVSIADKDLSLLWKYVIIEFSIVILSDLLGRLINLTDGLIGDLYNNASSEKIIRKSSQLSMAQLEDPVVYDKLERARTQTSQRVGLMSNVL